MKKNDKTVCTIIKSSFRRYNLFIYGSCSCYIYIYFLQLEIHIFITSFCGGVNFIVEKRKTSVLRKATTRVTIPKFDLDGLIHCEVGGWMVLSQLKYAAKEV